MKNVPHRWDVLGHSLIVGSLFLNVLLIYIFLMIQTYLIVQDSRYDLGMLIIAWHCHQCVGMLLDIIP